MSDLERVVVLAGGLSNERQVSLRSGTRVSAALRAAGVEVAVWDVDASLIDELAADPPQVVFPLLHGVAGEDGTVKEVLELLGVPYVGAAPGACRTAFDKAVAKEVLSRAGVATPASVTLPKAAFHDLGATAVMARVVERLGLPLFVKPRAGGSAFGVTRVERAEELPGALMTCFGHHDEALVERAVAGTEIAVAVADLGEGPRALPTVEIAADGVYDYAARYTAGAVRFHIPARVPAAVAEEAARVAVRAHQALGLRHLSRTDAIVDAAGGVWVLETNVAPGLTETSTFPLAVEAAGLDFGLFCRELAASAVPSALGAPGAR
ncbi:D-alanine--D-alanine ligase family protein [Streptomyces triticirhizae]|uniref:D-alanine--D-alanine ligase n=1 Tax=Streptomyces triticirhizae TaxID=2483353 RepID=A0A3M2LI96_9ACTN|nr:D-alanine--D-alanine ligase [Streptomyces triticirhizae]RMI36846.1 D-alanine--D-alanine ligase [Streptomyces triticirhizae]